MAGLRGGSGGGYSGVAYWWLMPKRQINNRGS